MSGIAVKEIPDNWEKVKLGDIVNIVYGKNLPTKDLKDDGYPVYGANGIIGKYDRYLYEEEQVLISCRGAYSGKANMSPPFAYITNNSLVLETLSESGLNKKYLYYWLNIADKSTLVTGSAQPQVTINNAVELSVPLAPPEQQKRIVAKIEELFSHIDAGIEALKKAKQLLKQYRQSVLKAAVTGELTKEWREARIKDDAQGSANVAGGRTPGATKLEPASQLLKRILKERRQKWEEQQLEQFKAKGKMPKDDKWKKQYNEPIQDVEKFFVEPEGWAWTEIGTITDMLSGHAFKKAEYAKTGVRLFQIANVSFGYTKWDEIEHLPESYLEEWKHLKLEEGDVLMALNRPLLSKQLKIARLGKSDVPSILYQRVGKFQFYLDAVSDYFLLYMQSPYYINRLEEQLQGVNIPFINKGKLLETPISMPSCEEELELIVDEANKRLDGISRLETEIDEQLIKAEKNKQSVLASAFSGQI